MALMGLLLSHNCTVQVWPDRVQISRQGEALPQGGGEREECEDFTRQSRKRLFELLHSLKFTRVLFVTLTYPAEYPRDWHVYKRHLRAFRARLERAFGKVRVVWRLEYQRRGAPHYHLLLLDPPCVAKAWVSHAWYEVVGSEDERHLLAGTNTQDVNLEDGPAVVAAYIGKYVAKSEDTVDDADVGKTGRHWGRWNIQVQKPLVFQVASGEANRLAIELFASRGGGDTWRPADYHSCTILGDALGSDLFMLRAVALIAAGEFPRNPRKP